MRLFSAKTFGVEAVVIAVASVSVVVLALFLVRDAIEQTEGTLLSAAQEELTSAARELKEQYEERAAFSDRPLQALPLEAQDLSLRGLTQTVLRSYNDVQGGFFITRTKSVVGSAGPQNSIGSNEMRAIQSSISEVSSRGRQPTATIADGPDLLVASAVRTSDSNFAWTLKRLIGVRDPAPNRRRWLLATTVIAAVAGVTGVVSILIRLRRGVAGVKRMLQQLETDFTYRDRPASGDFGEISAAIGRMADRRLELETTVRRQDRLAALGKVVAGVAHEIRNPLNSIRLQLELLKRKTQRGLASTTEVEAAMCQVDRLNMILGQLLGLGKPDLSNREVQSVLPLVYRAVAIVQDRADALRVGLRIDAEENSDTQANVDGLQMEQVLTNLFLNAIDASPEGSQIGIKIAEADGTVEMAVSDQGPGIAESIQEHVFDAFFTTRPEGTGLGLSVSREIVTAHRGSISFETSPSGTTFVVTLPSGRAQ